MIHMVPALPAIEKILFIPAMLSRNNLMNLNPSHIVLELRPDPPGIFQIGPWMRDRVLSLPDAL